MLLTENSQNLSLERNHPITTWYDYGNFLITKVEKTDTTGNYKFESADYTKKFNKVFDGDYTDTTYVKSFNERLNDEETVDWKGRTADSAHQSVDSVDRVEFCSIGDRGVRDQNRIIEYGHRSMIDEHCDAGDPLEGRRVYFQIFIGQIISKHKIILFYWFRQCIRALLALYVYNELFYYIES